MRKDQTEVILGIPVVVKLLLASYLEIRIFSLNFSIKIKRQERLENQYINSLYISQPQVNFKSTSR